MSVLKIFLIVWFSVGTVFASQGDKIYLLPMSSNDYERIVLREAIVQQARADKAICGIDNVIADKGLDADLPCMLLGICNLSPKERQHVIFTNSPFADAIASLVYFYQKLLLIQAWEQYETYGQKSPQSDPS